MDAWLLNYKKLGEEFREDEKNMREVIEVIEQEDELELEEIETPQPETDINLDKVVP